jgi:predicted O-methyltransferase YrrM
MLLAKNKRIRQAAAILETGNLLFLKLLLRNPREARRYPAEVFRAYLALAGRDRWACRPVFDVLPSADPPPRITLEHVRDETILTPLEQLACLALITRALEPECIFEIGTFRGRTALNFALNSPAHCRVYTLDLPPGGQEPALESASAADRRIIGESEPGRDYRGKDVEGKIEQLLGDSQSFDFSPWSGKVDLVYVDGAHHYEAVRSDTDNALRMLRPGGYLLWDEFGNYGDYNDITRAVLDALGADAVVQIENTQLGVYRKPWRD